MKESWRPGRQSLLLDCWCSLPPIRVAIRKGTGTNCVQANRTGKRKNSEGGGFSQLRLMVDPIGSWIYPRVNSPDFSRQIEEMLLATSQFPSVDLWVSHGYYRKGPVSLMLLPFRIQETNQKASSSPVGGHGNQSLCNRLTGVGEV